MTRQGNRLTSIETLTGAIQIYDLAYAYDYRDLPISIAESSFVAGPIGTTSYAYDNRGRLTDEVRTGQNPYNLAYEYDDGGNRTKKTNTTTSRETIYVYDLSNPGLFGGKNNRLMKADEYDTAPNPDVLLNTTWYLYNCEGNVERVVKRNGNGVDYSATRLAYGKNGRTVTFIADETNGLELPVHNLTVDNKNTFFVGIPENIDSL